ncbi:MAG: hypothetical protein JSR76_06805 [Verrucomicrobia bacterium]|nr:hypothetical protein [Verrucomicrobiota bacterium]
MKARFFFALLLPFFLHGDPKQSSYPDQTYEWHVIPYVQADAFLVPGVGISLQWDGAPVGLEIDGYLSAVLAYGKISFSGLLPITDHSYCNLGVGPIFLPWTGQYGIGFPIGYNYRGDRDHQRWGLILTITEKYYGACYTGKRPKYKIEVMPLCRFGYSF